MSSTPFARWNCSVRGLSRGRLALLLWWINGGRTGGDQRYK